MDKEFEENTLDFTDDDKKIEAVIELLKIQQAEITRVIDQYRRNLEHVFSFLNSELERKLREKSSGTPL